MHRATFVAGVATGYVLGARAGRDRYEVIARAARRLADRPEVQGVAGLVRAQGSLAAHGMWARLTGAAAAATPAEH